MSLLKQSYVKHGLIMSSLIAVCLIYMEVTGQNESFDQKSPVIIFVMMILPFIVWWMGIKVRKDMQKGKLTFKQGITEGFKISLVYGLTSPLVFLFYYLFINPPIIEYVRTAYQMTEASDAMVMTVDLTIQLVSALIFGTIYAVIISFFLKSKSE